MSELGQPDKFHLSAAVGWYELGLVEEAQAELERIQGDSRNHPDVLQVRYTLLAELKDWQKALETAQRLMDAAPEIPDGWLHAAYAARRAPNGNIQLAWQILSEAAGKFPRTHLIPYNLACYAAQMNRLEEARLWLHRAEKIKGAAEIRRMALKDPDLQALWEELRKEGT